MSGKCYHYVADRIVFIEGRDDYRDTDSADAIATGFNASGNGLSECSGRQKSR
jgi:hypothetical protein